MKNKHFVFFILLVLGLYLGLPTACEAYSVLLPDVMPPETLPYIATADHYNGAACVQMALNTCPNVVERQYHPDQLYLYNQILSHDAELGLWFSNPEGLRATLMDSYLTPCGNWVDYSNSDRDSVIGAMLYWLDHSRYLVPVSITDAEKWVAVCGFHSDVQPTTTTYDVELYRVFLYDPTPGATFPFAMVDASVWESDAQYWEVPFNNPASSWHDKYIAIIEPPPVNIKVKIPEWVLEGPILPVEDIRKAFYGWLEEVRREDIAKGPFEILAKPHEIGKPFLVDAGKYKYYMVPFKDRRLVATFNAYNGRFEEFRQFKQPQNYILDSKTIRKNLAKTFKKYKTKDFKIQKPQFKYRSALAQTGRFSPTWQVAANVTDVKGKKHELTVSLNSAGHVIKGLEALPTPPKPSSVEPVEKKRPLFSIHTGTAIPMGDFADLYKAGINILVDFEYPLKKHFSLRALLGYNQFKSKLVELDDTSIVNINLNLKYSTPGKPLTFFAEAGPGYYIIKDADNKKMGVNVGCGFNFRLSQRIRLEFATHHNTIFTSEKNTYFFHLAGGLIIRF
ncbi:MAG: hypothetical protein JSV88_26075 [Candidatus Aminicenantes bacterium]|nr:MAG: hypothetical protein JSV88_26075 [Candidatus Aminicenantes bacterium]